MKTLFCTLVLILFALIGQAQDVATGVNRVLELDGTDGGVELPSMAFNHLRDVTVEGWVKWQSLGNHSRFFDFGIEGKVVFLCNVLNTDNLWFFPLSKDEWIPQVQNVIATNQWRHVAVVMGSAGMTLYLNGVRVVSSTNTTPFNQLNGGEHNFLGRSNFRGPPFNDSDLHGQMDEVRIWNTARTQAESVSAFSQLKGIMGCDRPISNWRVGESMSFI